MARGRKPGFRTPDMASRATNSVGGASSNKQIPLLCNVCPDAPRFSDVSHLLTHIASKGHLHHETQTKLRAHQDLAASVALRSYEDWYSQHGIEALLVERMKTKQLKEAARTRRNRSLLPSSTKAAKRKQRRALSNSVLIKAEENDEITPECLIYPGLPDSDDDVEAPDDHLPSADILSLKGQVWPGMGKMDLANEEMKRTRNQRKPKSVIEKMKRASEGIEPTQVVMTSEFEVERVKGVYDESSSPTPGQEESTPPRKTTRAKRRKPQPLAEISGNVPRQRRTNTRSIKSEAARNASKNLKREADENSAVALPLESFRPHQDVFRDDTGGHGSIENRRFLKSSRNDYRFDLHNRFGAMPPLNPISQANLASPTPSSRDLSSRMFGLREGSRARAQPQTFLGSFGQMEASYAMKDATIYNASLRFPFGSPPGFNGIDNDLFGLSHSSFQPKQEDCGHQNPRDHVQRTNGSQFMNMSGTNPLYHDRLFLGSFNQTSRSSSVRPLTFTPINPPREQTKTARDSNNTPSNDESAKLDAQAGGAGESDNFCNGKVLDFAGTWSLPSGSQDLDLQNNLNPEDLRI